MSSGSFASTFDMRLICFASQNKCSLSWYSIRFRIPANLSVEGWIIVKTEAIFISSAKRPKCVAALGTCHESRQIALKAGYRRWRIRDSKGKKRTIVWDPSRDTVDLTKFQLRGIKLQRHLLDPQPDPLLLLQEECFKEIKQIRYLAVPTGLWTLGDHLLADAVLPLMSFTGESLQHCDTPSPGRYWDPSVDDWSFCRTERTRGCFKPLLLRGSSNLRDFWEEGSCPTWFLPDHIELNIDTYRERYEKYGAGLLPPLGRKPTVRIATSKSATIIYIT